METNLFLEKVGALTIGGFIGLIIWIFILNTSGYLIANSEPQGIKLKWKCENGDYSEFTIYDDTTIDCSN